MCLALPVFASNPVIPLIGAILVVATTLVYFFADRWIRDHTPSTDTEKIYNYGQPLFRNRNVMFRPASGSSKGRLMRRTLSEFQRK